MWLIISWSQIFFFFFCKLIYLFQLETNYFTIFSGFCHTLTWLSHGCTCVPHPEPPSPLPPNSIPSLWVIPVHQPWAPCIMHQTWTGDSFHILYFTCFNDILPYHPTLILSAESKKLFNSFYRWRKGAMCRNSRVSSDHHHEISYAVVWSVLSWLF